MPAPAALRPRVARALYLCSALGALGLVACADAAAPRDAARDGPPPPPPGAQCGNNEFLHYVCLQERCSFPCCAGGQLSTCTIGRGSECGFVQVTVCGDRCVTGGSCPDAGIAPMDATPDASAADATSDADDAPSDVASDSEPPTDSGEAGASCAAGTCRLAPESACEPPTGPTGNGCCRCGDDGACAEVCRCADPDTPVATPFGERPIAALRVGDLVYSAHRGALAVVPIARVNRAPAVAHHVVRVEFAHADAPALEISPGHPTADGRTFGDLRPGDTLDGRVIARADLVPYPHAFTYDVLPESDTGTYVAGGALIGSTLFRASAPAIRPQP